MIKLSLPQLPPLPPFLKPPTVPAAGVMGLASSVVVAPMKGWCSAKFYDVLTGDPMTFSKPPAVVALAEVRAGDILPVEAPVITVPKVEVGKVPKIEIPYRVIPELPLTVYRCTYRWGWWIFHAECGWAKIVVDPDSVPDWFKESIPERLKPPYQCPQGHGSGYIKKIDGTKPEEWASAMRGYSLYCAREFAGNWTLLITGDFNWLRDLVMNAIG